MPACHVPSPECDHKYTKTIAAVINPTTMEQNKQKNMYDSCLPEHYRFVNEGKGGGNREERKGERVGKKEEENI